MALKKELGFWSLTLSGVGLILGAGIYALIGTAAGIAGNSLWLSFLIAAFLAVLTGLSYSELGSMFPKAGGEYIYTRKGLGKRFAFIIGWFVAFEAMLAVAAVALGFAGYFKELIGIPILIGAIGIIIACAALNWIGVKETVRFGVLFTLIEAAGLLLIIFIGLPYMSSVSLTIPTDLSPVFVASALIFFAYLGFDDMAQMAEETKDASHTLPKALLTAVAITTVFYILVSLSALGVVGAEALAASNAPLALVASTALGPWAFTLLAVIALFATANTVLFCMLSSSRVLYGMSMNKSLPKQLSWLTPGQTPGLAVIFVCIVSLVFVMYQDLTFAANITNFVIFITFFAVNLSVIVLRFSKPKVKRAFKVPFNIGPVPVTAVLGILSCLYMLTLFEMDIIKIGVLIGVIGIVIGFAFDKS